MPTPHIVIDTNVMVAGLRSRRGSAFRLRTLVGTGRFDIHLSVPLVLEYEEVLLRELPHLQVPRTVVDDVLDFHCTVATRHQIFFLWRPYLSDPSDDMLLELAVTARCDFIVAYNARDFVSVERFALRVIEPGAFLQHIGALP
jgi:putative PIN family toxin of toxin-antitoxin system